MKAAGLVTSSWLRMHLSGSQSVKVLDSSWTALKSGKEDFLSKHIPTATFFDLNHCVKAEPTLPRNLPDPKCFEDYAQSIGVSKDTHLVVYDRGSMLAAARTWWTFRAFGHNNISVLDGGMNKWVSDGNDMADGDTKSNAGNFQVNKNISLIKTFEEMLENLKQRSIQVLDARRPEHFIGAEQEPTGFTSKALEGMNQPLPKFIARGHIPGAMNLLEDYVLNGETKCLLSKDQLLQVFQSVGVDLNKPLSTMCYNGHAAALLALATYVCGKEDTGVYYGSWTEWGQRASRDHITGPQTTPATGG